MLKHANFPQLKNNDIALLVKAGEGISLPPPPIPLLPPSPFPIFLSLCTLKNLFRKIGINTLKTKVS
jgi:hypothetical protein